MYKMCPKCGFMYDDNGSGCPQCGEGKSSQDSTPTITHQNIESKSIEENVIPTPSVPANKLEKTKTEVKEETQEAPIVNPAPIVSPSQPEFIPSAVPTPAKETSVDTENSSSTNTQNKKIVPIIIAAFIAIIVGVVVIGMISSGNSPDPEPNYDNYDDAVVDSYEPYEETLENNTDSEEEEQSDDNFEYKGGTFMFNSDMDLTLNASDVDGDCSFYEWVDAEENVELEVEVFRNSVDGYDSSEFDLLLSERYADAEANEYTYDVYYIGGFCGLDALVEWRSTGRHMYELIIYTYSGDSYYEFQLFSHDEAYLIQLSDDIKEGFIQ